MPGAPREVLLDSDGWRWVKPHRLGKATHQVVPLTALVVENDGRKRVVIVADENGEWPDDALAILYDSVAYGYTAERVLSELAALSDERNSK